MSPSQILITLLMVIGTALVQLVLQIILDVLTPTQSRRRESTRLRRVTVTVMAVGVLMAGLLVEVSIWAVRYWTWGELGDFSSSLYFSLAAFTTLGADELELSRAHRLIGSIESAVGMIMFGWSTALLVSLVRVHEQLRHEHSGHQEQAARHRIDDTYSGRLRG